MKSSKPPQNTHDDQIVGGEDDGGEDPAANPPLNVHGDRLAEVIGTPDPRLEYRTTGEVASNALGFLQELVARVRRYCEDTSLASDLRRDACQLLVNLSAASVDNLQSLACAFPTPFREIAEQRASFPCKHFAHPEAQKKLESFVLSDLNLGNRHPLKLRSRRKTFSVETPANQVLLYYIQSIKDEAARCQKVRTEQLITPEDVPLFPLEIFHRDVPLTLDSVPQWIEVIWRLLLQDFPAPENHAVFKRVDGRRRRGVADAMGESASLKARAAKVRAGIKRGLRLTLVKMLRGEMEPTPR